ncbi:MAG: glycosyltransferase [Nanoarchaeota archaeon]|nr:glycosyltransferase [Nanoarchaeota archaeon]
MLSLFIPCYNEENCIEPNVKTIHSVLKNHQKEDPSFKFEIIIVNDCSNDNTEEISDRVASEVKEIRAIHYHAAKPTRRENLIRSFQHAKGDIIAYTDADLSTDITDLPFLYNQVTDRNTIVVGDRYHKQSKVTRTLKRFMISKTLNYLTRVMFFDWKKPFNFDSGSRDHFCGFKAFPKEVIMNLLEYTGVGSRFRGMWWDAEMLIFAERLGYNIKRIPVKWIEGAGTTLRFGRELRMFFYMINLWGRMKWTKSTKLG